MVHTTTRRTLNGCLTSVMIGAAHMLLRNNTERYVLYCVDGSSLSAVVSFFKPRSGWKRANTKVSERRAHCLFSAFYNSVLSEDKKTLNFRTPLRQLKNHHGNPVLAWRARRIV